VRNVASDSTNRLIAKPVGMRPNGWNESVYFDLNVVPVELKMNTHAI